MLEWQRQIGGSKDEEGFRGGWEAIVIVQARQK